MHTTPLAGYNREIGHHHTTRATSEDIALTYRCWQYTNTHTHTDTWTYGHTCTHNMHYTLQASQCRAL